MSDFEVKFEFIKEKVNPNSCARPGRYARIIDMWLETDNKTLKFSRKNAKQRKNVCNSARSYAKAHSYDYVAYPEKGTYNVYLVKA